MGINRFGTSHAEPNKALFPSKTMATFAATTRIGSPQEAMSFKPIDLTMGSHPARGAQKREHPSSPCNADNDDDGEHLHRQSKRRRAAVTPSPSPSPTRHDRSVRFATRLVSHVFTVERFDDIAPYPTTDDEDIIVSPSPKQKKNLWWTKDEKYQIMQRNRLHADEFELEHSDKVAYFLRVFDDLCEEEPPITTTTTEANDDDDEYRRENAIRIPTKVRGLEYCVTPSIKSYRKLHVQHVLDVQRQLRRRLTSDFRTNVLSIRAIQSSHPSRVLAQLIGEGDAHIAAAEAHSSPASPRSRHVGMETISGTFQSSRPLTAGSQRRQRRRGQAKMITDKKTRHRIRMWPQPI